MSKIKYRAFDKAKNKYIYDIQNCYDCNLEYEDGEVCGESCFGHYLDDDNYVIQKCLNKTDRNGNLFWEGDLIKDNDGAVFVVEWGDEEQSYYYIGAKNTESTDTYTTFYFQNDFEEFVVIGRYLTN